jgi:hypothetical protein
LNSRERFDPNHSDIGGAVNAHYLGVSFRIVVEDNSDRGRSFDYMGVGEDVPCSVYNKSRTQRTFYARTLRRTAIRNRRS